MMKEISVVIPSKNEEKTIAKCIESVQRALNGKNSYEIILADSCSMDQTVNIAKKYPINIYRLRKHWPMSPSAGRYIGTIKSNGKYILFLDADMVLSAKWLDNALEVMERDENLAGMTGRLFHILPNNKYKQGTSVDGPFEHVNFLPGAAIYRRNILEEINNFNPFIVGFEEKELGYRITQKGYHMYKTKEIICYHYVKEKNLKEVDEKAKYSTGVGQYLRLHFSVKNFSDVLKRYPLLMFINFYFLALILILFISILSNYYLFFFSAIGLAVFPTIALMIRHRNLKKTYLFLYGTLARFLNFINGIIKKPKNSKDYPIDAEVIK